MTYGTPMTDEQRFFYDLRGWILLPAVLSEDEIEPLKAQCYSGIAHGYLGAVQELIDHPAITGILAELLAEPHYHREDSYPFRCEGSFVTVRHAGWKKEDLGGTEMPHVVRPPQHANPMRYQVAGNRIFSGLTRVVWELEEVKEGTGGTSFLSGSHKANFPYGGPDPYHPDTGGSPWEPKIRAMMDTYGCPAGSALVFTESLLHASEDWTNPDNPRCAIFNCYNSVWAQWHLMATGDELAWAPEFAETMPPRRRSLFRGVWQLGTLHGTEGNVAYADDNRAV